MTEKKNQLFCEDDQDAIFRFTIAPQLEKGEDPLMELIRLQLQALLDIIVLLQGDTAVEVEAFRFINSSQTNPIWTRD